MVVTSTSKNDLVLIEGNVFLCHGFTILFFSVSFLSFLHLKRRVHATHVHTPYTSRVEKHPVIDREMFGSDTLLYTSFSSYLYNSNGRFSFS